MMFATRSTIRCHFRGRLAAWRFPAYLDARRALGDASLQAVSPAAKRKIRQRIRPCEPIQETLFERGSPTSALQRWQRNLRQNAGRTISSGRRCAVAFLGVTGLSAPGGGPIVQPRVWRPHASHRKNKRLGSRARPSSCPKSEHQSREGVNGQRSPFTMTLSFRGGRAP